MELSSEILIWVFLDHTKMFWPQKNLFQGGVQLTQKLEPFWSTDQWLNCLFDGEGATFLGLWAKLMFSLNTNHLFSSAVWQMVIIAKRDKTIKHFVLYQTSASLSEHAFKSLGYLCQ